MRSQIELYEEMSMLSARMVDAARANDWESLTALERSVSELRSLLMQADDDASLSPGDSLAKRALIQRILDDDAEIRRHTEPWMEHLRRFLGDGAKKRQVDRAYGASQV